VNKSGIDGKQLPVKELENIINDMQKKGKWP
jgi:hypothetical protein